MFLSKTDLFGYSLQPTFKGNSKINTVLGGVVSLLLVGLFTFGFFFVGREIVEKKNPISNVSAIAIEDAPISLKEIPMFFGAISDEGKLLHLDKEFNRSLILKARLYETQTSENGQFKFSYYNVPMVFCNKDLMGEEYYDIAKATQEGIDYALCLDYNNITAPDGSKYPKDISFIKNPFGSQNSAYLNINLEMCDESLDPGCREGIESVGSFNFAISHPQEILNISDNSNPISKSFKSTSTSVSSGLAFSQTINFNINELVSDEGWIFEQNNTKTFYTADAAVYNATKYSESDRILGRSIFAVNLTKNSITRRYMKLQELVANLGGFIKVSMMIFSFFIDKYSQWSLYTQIINMDSKSSKTNLSNSGVIMNNLAGSSNPTSLAEAKNTHPTFFQFVLASLCKTKARKYKIKWDESLRYLDLTYIKKQFEQLDLLLRASNVNKH